MRLGGRTAIASAVAVAMSAGIVAVALGVTRAGCETFDDARLLVLRVDGTSLGDWEQTPRLRALLPEAAAAVVIVPPLNPISAGSDAADSDPVLAGRRAAAGLTARIQEGPEAVVVSSSLDFEPLLPVAEEVDAATGDPTRPTGMRLDPFAARRAITTTPGAVEIDISDTWRAETDLRASAARASWALDSLQTVAAPLVELGLQDSRPVMLVSVIGSVERMRQDQQVAAVALFGDRSGLLQAPGGHLAAGMVGLAAISNLTTQQLCVDGTSDGGLAAYDLERSLLTAQHGHAPAVAVMLALATLVIWSSVFAIAGGHLGRGSRSVMVITAAGLLLLPALSMVEGLSVSTGVVARGVALLMSFALGALVFILRPTYSAIGTASIIGVAVPSVAMMVDPILPARALLASPIASGLRITTTDPVILGMMLAATALAAAWIADQPRDRALRAGVTMIAALSLGVVVGILGGLATVP
ncbi:MAG: hypothetical protein ACLGH3_04075, partial [Actinomycetota bacterium]